VSGAIAIGKTLVVTLLLVQPKPEGVSATKQAGCSGGHAERKCFSIQPELTGTNTLTVRAWIGTKSFEEQQDFGIIIIIAFGGTV
jgi:hypothetical protein